MFRTFLTIALFASSLAAVRADAADDFDARLKLGTELAARGDRVAARALFEALVVEAPQRPEPYNDLAALAAAEGDLERARTLLERALATEPNYRAVHDNLSAIYAAQASQAYRKALPLEGAPPLNPALAMLEGRAPEAVAAAARPTTVPITVPSVSFVYAPSTTPARAPATPVGARSPIAAPAADPFDRRAAEVFGAVDAWVRAWTRRDVGGYTSAYSPGYVPPDGLTRVAWESQRAERIRAPKRIAITIRDRHLVLERDGRHAHLTFTQNYSSDRFNGVSFKTMDLVESQGRWLIAAERTGR